MNKSRQVHDFVERHLFMLFFQVAIVMKNSPLRHTVGTGIILTPLPRAEREKK